MQARTSGGGQVQQLAENSWRLSIPAGDAGVYRWAQLDDYLNLPRTAFHWGTPMRMELTARVSAADLPGTWGFGLWNDPFSASLGLGGTARRLPALPNAAWFFYAAAPNWLAFGDVTPAQGFLNATFSSPHLPPALLMAAGLAAPSLLLPFTARLARKAAHRLINEDAAPITAALTDWHTYHMDYLPDQVRFAVDGQIIFQTRAAPRPPLGFVLWIDNQYAAFPPDGRVKMGMSANPHPAWLEVRDLILKPC